MADLAYDSGAWVNATLLQVFGILTNVLIQNFSVVVNLQNQIAEWGFDDW